MHRFEVVDRLKDFLNEAEVVYCLEDMDCLETADIRGSFVVHCLQVEVVVEYSLDCCPDWMVVVAELF